MSTSTSTHPSTQAAGIPEPVEELAEAFTGLGGRLETAARALRSHGRPPSDDLIDEMELLRQRFATAAGPLADEPSPPGSLGELRDRLNSRAAASVAAPEPEPEPVPAAEPVPAPTPVGAGVAEALARIDRVLGLRFQGAGDASPLLACHEKARAARAAVEAGPPEEAAAVMEDRHSFHALLALVERPGTLNDSTWADYHETLIAAFGRPLAMAVSRGKVRAGG